MLKVDFISLKRNRIFRFFSMPYVNIKRFILNQKYKQLSEPLKLNKLKDVGKGKRCFIIGNGPSLNIGDLEKLNNEITFASNRIYKLLNELYRIRIEKEKSTRKTTFKDTLKVNSSNPTIKESTTKEIKNKVQKQPGDE